MKRYFKYILTVAAAASTLTACDDFFDPETDDTLDGDKYMSSLTEMYTGALGIYSKMQAIGDKSIYLTDTRGELLEPSERSIGDLIALYNYEDDLSGNEYADPAGYYDVVIACNDYLQNILDFKKEYPELVAESPYYEGLISMALRIKVWAYLTMAEIYGQTLWFDDPIYKITDLSDSNTYQLLTLDGTVDKCIDVLVNGYKGYRADLSFSWKDYLDPETALANSTYRYWDMMTPPYGGLLSRLYLWKGAALDAAGAHEAAVPYYKTVADTLLSAINYQFATTGNSSNPQYYSRSTATPGNYGSYWDNSGKDPYARTVIGVITYNYLNNQTNRLLHHFSNEYPNAYLLRPAEIGRQRWEDDEFNPGASAANEKRGGVVCKQNNGVWYLGKYRPVGSTRRVNPYEDDVCIYTFRSEDYLFMLTEALNALGRYVVADGVLNQGIFNRTTELDSITNHRDSCSVALIQEWDGFNTDWTSNPSWGTAKYPYVGIRGCMTLASRVLKTEQTEEARQYNDSLLANEYVLEFSAEGKIYPALIRFAKRYNDPTFITDRVTPKYGEKAAMIESKILSNNPTTGLPGYFVPWDLKVK